METRVLTLQEPGSSDRIDIYRADENELATPAAIRNWRTWLARHLAATLPSYWPAQPNAQGVPESVDQVGSWAAELARVAIAGGEVWMARHTSSADNLIAVWVTVPVNDGRNTKLVVSPTAAYSAETVDTAMMSAVKDHYRNRGRAVAMKVIKEEWVPL